MSRKFEANDDHFIWFWSGIITKNLISLFYRQQIKKKQNFGYAVGKIKKYNLIEYLMQIIKTMATKAINAIDYAWQCNLFE